MRKVIIVPKITSGDERNHCRAGYRAAHMKANNTERSVVGNHKFEELNRKIQRLPKGHWAGTHTIRGNIHISNEVLKMYPKKDRTRVARQIKIHEVAEHKFMGKK